MIRQCLKCPEDTGCEFTSLCRPCRCMSAELYLSDTRIKLHTEGNVLEQELVFNIESTYSCGSIVDGIGCRLVGESGCFIIDPNHLQEILDKWHEMLKREMAMP